ncbi:MAG: tetratricopeptide repeat protein [Chitinophagaceae bacterium]|nr:tetratricopeptide repeat protein [Chitinophagaceae bacterium]
MQKLQIPVFFLKSLFAVWIVGMANAAFCQDENRMLRLRAADEGISPPLLRAYFDSLKLAKQQQKPLEIVQYTHQIGQLLYSAGTFAQALDYLLQAINIARSQKLRKQLAEVLYTIGMVYYYNQQPEKSATAFAEAYDIFNRINEPAGMARALGGIGFLLEKKQLTDSAAAIQQKALIFAQQANDQKVMAEIYENLGSILEDKGLYDEAYIYFSKANDLYRLLDEQIAQIQVLNNLGDVFRKKGMVNQGLSYTVQAFENARAFKHKYQQQSALRDLSKCYALLGKYDSAYQKLEESRELMQQIYAEETVRQVALVEVLNETALKDADILQLQAQRRVNYLLIGLLAAGIFLLAGMAAAIYNRQKLKLQSQQEIQNQQEIIFAREKSLMEAELKNKQLEEAQLKYSLNLKEQALSSQLLHLILKNEVLEKVKNDLIAIIKDDKRDQKKQLRQLLQQINESFNNDKYWEEFRSVFDQVHQTFFAVLLQKCPDLTPNETKLLTLIKMNLSQQEIATLLGITSDSLRVSRYRLKKKLNLQQEDSLTGFVQSL